MITTLYLVLAAPHVYLDAPLLNPPYTLDGGVTSPSMRQSLAVTSDVHQLTHAGVALVLDPYHERLLQRVLARLAITGLDLVTVSLPFTDAWVHEEWHRAVLTSHGASSHNDVYDMRFTALIAVSHVKDADLSRLKRESPADQVRLSTAGIESEYELPTALEKATFFEDTEVWNQSTLWLSYLQNTFYLGTCASPASDTETDIANRQEGTDVARRDFTGLDCNGWVYDLYHPNEPYAARGVHPSGVGIDRYRSFLRQSPEERRYLKRQYQLSYLNFLDPNLLGFEQFRFGDARWNSSLRYQATAFGSTVDANLFLRGESLGVFFVLHNYLNRRQYYPGVELELRPYSMSLGSWPCRVGGRAMVWVQPRDLRFTTRAGTPGGLLAVHLGYDTGGELEPYVEVSGKTEGWVAGEVYTGASVSGLVGVAARLF